MDHTKDYAACQGCDERIAAMTPQERAAIPLRRAAHAFCEAWSDHFDAVVNHRPRNEVARLEEIGERMNAQLNAAAIEYARKIAELAGKS